MPGLSRNGRGDAGPGPDAGPRSAAASAGRPRRLGAGAADLSRPPAGGLLPAAVRRPAGDAPDVGAVGLPVRRVRPAGAVSQAYAQGKGPPRIPGRRRRPVPGAAILQYKRQHRKRQVSGAVFFTPSWGCYTFPSASQTAASAEASSGPGTAKTAASPGRCPPG